MQLIRQLAVILLIVAAPVKAVEHAVGTHGMVLMKAADHLIASHMPLNHPVHGQQLILELTVDSQYQPALHALLDSSQLVSLLPETFDLNRLATGELTSFKADVFDGHFERYGSRLLSNATFSVKQILLSSSIRPVGNGSYYLLELSGNESLLVHRIGELPSYDQIIWVTRQEPMITPQLLAWAKEEPLGSDDFEAYQEKGLSNNEILYLETNDFLAR